jgi:hypothetical protein
VILHATLARCCIAIVDGVRIVPVNRFAATVARATVAIQVPLTVYFRAVVEPVPLAIGTLDEFAVVLVNPSAVNGENALVGRLPNAVHVTLALGFQAIHAVFASYYDGQVNRVVVVSRHCQMLSCAELLLDFSANSYNEFMP